MTATVWPAIVIGAGPAGLAASQALTRRGVSHIAVEKGDAAGHSWARLYDSLRLHTGKHMSALPGMSFPASAPLFTPRSQFLDYLKAYAQRFALPVSPSTEVMKVERTASSWRLVTSAGEMDAQHLVIATGIISNPQTPNIPGLDSYQGRALHSIQYLRPEPFVGQRVLVVGVGNSGAEIAAELARSGAHVTVAVRSGAYVMPLTVLGVPIQYWSRWMQALPRNLQRAIALTMVRAQDRRRGPPPLPRPPRGPLERPPVIGFGLVDAIRAGQVAVEGDVRSLTKTGAVFQSGRQSEYERVIFATGYKAALGMLDGLVRLDPRGFALRDGVLSLDHPNLYFVGHNYSAIGALANINRDARLTGHLVAARVSGRP